MPGLSTETTDMFHVLQCNAFQSPPNRLHDHVHSRLKATNMVEFDLPRQYVKPDELMVMILDSDSLRFLLMVNHEVILNTEINFDH